MRYIAAVIFKTANTYANAVKARIELTDEGENYVDFRSVMISQSVSATEHGSLAGLGDDNHPQYKLLAGRSSDITPVPGAAYTLLSTDYLLHCTYTPTGTVIITIPTAQITDGRKFTIKDAGFNAGTNNITVNTEGAETIDGQANHVMNINGDSFTFYSVGNNLFIK